MPVLHQAQRGPAMERGNLRFIPHPGVTPSRAGSKAGLHHEQLGGGWSPTCASRGFGPQPVDCVLHTGCLVDPPPVTMSQR